MARPRSFELVTPASTAICWWRAARGSHKDALSTFPPRGLALMTSRVSVERDNIRSGLANAIDAGDVARAVQIVANHPHRDRANASRIGQVFSVPASRVLELPGAAQHHDYPRPGLPLSFLPTA